MKLRFMKYFWLLFFVGGSVYFTLFSPIFTSEVYAGNDACYFQPQVYGGAITDKKIKSPNYNDIKMGGGMSFNPGQGVSYGFDAELTSYNYSQVFWNFYNLLTPFVSTNGAAAEAKYGPDRWKYKCLDVNTLSKGKISYETSGTISHDSCTYTPVESAGAWTWDLSCTGEDTSFSGVSDSQEVSVPYVNTIRQIARAIPPIIHDGPWYCPSSVPNFCADKYNLPNVDCQVTDLTTYPNVPQGADGLCVFRSPDTSTLAADILCAQPVNNTGQQLVYPPLASNVCAQATDPIFQDPTSKDSEPSTPAGPDVGSVSFSTKPYLSAGVFENKTNELPFDQEAIDKYYKPALVNKLGLYSKGDNVWLESVKNRKIDGTGQGLPAGFGIGGSASGVHHQSPIQKDIVDELGGDVEISNDFRFANPMLLPAGYSVVESGAHRAYLRGVSEEMAGTLFVDGKPLGARPTSTGARLEFGQTMPAIHQQIKGRRFAVATISHKALYVSVSDDIDHLGPLTPVNGFGDVGYEHFSLVTFVNSKGSVIVFYPMGGSGAQKYNYSMSFDGGRSFTSPKVLPIKFTFDGAFAIDELDGIHVVGQDDKSDTLYYSKFYFGDTGLTESVSSKPVNLDTDGLQLKADGYDSRPFSVQAYCALGGGSSGSFNSCFAYIAASVAQRGTSALFKQLGIVTTTYITNGNVFTKPQFAVRRSIDRQRGLLNEDASGKDPDMLNYDLGGRRFAESSTNNIAHIGTATIIVYRFLDYSGLIQMQYAYKESDDAPWKQGIPLSGKVSRDQDGAFGWGGYQGIGITPEGKVAFSNIESYTKYNPATDTYDAAGYKMCLFPNFIPGGSTTMCGPGKEEGIKYVVAPTQTNNGIQLADPVDPKLDVDK